MSVINYWKQFENTGKIQDYLTYSSLKNSEKKEDESAKLSASDEKATTAGVNPYAGIHMGNGNHIETDAYRRI